MSTGPVSLVSALAVFGRVPVAPEFTRATTRNVMLWPGATVPTFQVSVRPAALHPSLQLMNVSRGSRASVIVAPVQGWAPELYRFTK
jgi:hypothetical protein